MSEFFDLRIPSGLQTLRRITSHEETFPPQESKPAQITAATAAARAEKNEVEVEVVARCVDAINNTLPA